MKKTIVFPNIDFADSEFSELELSEKSSLMQISIISWDERELKITLKNPIQFIYKQGDIIANFFECCDETPFLTESLSKYYQNRPLTHPFKHYQLYDIDDFAFIEVIAESVSIEKSDHIVGFDS